LTVTIDTNRSIRDRKAIDTIDFEACLYGLEWFLPSHLYCLWEDLVLAMLLVVLVLGFMSRLASGPGAIQPERGGEDRRLPHHLTKNNPIPTMETCSDENAIRRTIHDMQTSLCHQEDAHGRQSAST
jgi:hypothetical protein